ncbi:hypothetical protein [Algibacter pacificus]|uniref:hypothetical protein n=1 Tax=Algibacter pacificus TaxID=2599389 RepID=UPI0016507887|nr:hypothetical protein [Algibacter pacificus]
MKNWKKELTDFSVEKLEERKEFTFYFNYAQCETNGQSGRGGYEGCRPKCDPDITDGIN